MAVMHKETFQIFHSDQNLVPEGYVEIDELIAPTIQVLNQKGYTTRFCCSGHPENDWLFRDSGEESGYHKAANPLTCYIMFAEGITLPNLPPDFEASQNTYLPVPRLVIEKWYVVQSAFDNQYYEKLRQILETMKQLYQWALDLPEFENSDPVL